MTFSATRDVWNRAFHRSGGPAPGPGDIALTALVHLHKIKMIGGLGHAVAFLTTEEYYAGVTGYRYFGLEEIASVLEAAKLCGSDVSALELLELRYNELVPSDDILTAAFEAVYKDSPNAFTPI